jgi:hypothetical protein
VQRCSTEFQDQPRYLYPKGEGTWAWDLASEAELVFGVYDADEAELHPHPGSDLGLDHGALARAFSQWPLYVALLRSVQLDEGASARVQAEVASLRASVAELRKQLEAIRADCRAGLADYLARERRLTVWAEGLPEPPDYGTSEPAVIARKSVEGLTDEEFDALFGGED